MTFSTSGSSGLVREQTRDHAPVAIDDELLEVPADLACTDRLGLQGRQMLIQRAKPCRH